MGNDYKIRVDFSLDDWTWLCHLLNDTFKRMADDECCKHDVEEVLAVIQAGEAVAD